MSSVDWQELARRALAYGLGRVGSGPSLQSDSQILESHEIQTLPKEKVHNYNTHPHQHPNPRLLSHPPPQHTHKQRKQAFFFDPDMANASGREAPK